MNKRIKNKRDKRTNLLLHNMVMISLSLSSNVSTWEDYKKVIKINSVIYKIPKEWDQKMEKSYYKAFKDVKLVNVLRKIDKEEKMNKAAGI